MVLELPKLAEVPPQKEIKIFCENYFTSVKLLRYLADEDYCAFGSIPQGRIHNCPLPDKKIWSKQKTDKPIFQASKKFLQL